MCTDTDKETVVLTQRYLINELNDAVWRYMEVYEGIWKYIDVYVRIWMYMELYGGR